MKVSVHSYRNGTLYWLADGTYMGRRVLVEAIDRLSAIIGWINTAQERAE